MGWIIKKNFISVLAAIYVVSPIDIIPDFIAVLGWIDDVLVVLWWIKKVFFVQEKVKSIVGDKPKKIDDKSIKVGDVVVLGEYHGKCIEWQVLDDENRKILLLSKKAVACRQYHSQGSVTWENCNLRKWLNGEFYQKSFKDIPDGIVVETELKAHSNPKYYTVSGNDTVDKVFLLDFLEVEHYFPKKEDRICFPESWVRDEGAFVAYNGACWWWLRSPGCGIPGSTSEGAVVVINNGEIGLPGDYVYSDKRVVRPAMWVDLSKV